MPTPASTILENKNTYEKYVESHTRVKATALSKIIADLSYDIKELKESMLKASQITVNVSIELESIAEKI